MSAVAGPPRLAHPWALGIGLVLLLPQLVLTVLVLRNPIVVGLAGFAMTLGFIRLGLLTYRVGRERRPPLKRGVTAAVGLAVTIVGSLLFAAARSAAAAAADPGFSGLVAPAPAIGLGLVVVACAGLYVCGVVLLLASILGAVSDARARRR